MFPRKHRLAKTAEVQSTLKRGRSFFNSYCTIKYLSKPDQTRITIIVSTKVSKKATVRNRVKRVLREAIRPYLLLCRPGNYVIIAKPSAAKAVASDVGENLIRLLRSAHLIKKQCLTQ